VERIFSFRKRKTLERALAERSERQGSATKRLKIRYLANLQVLIYKVFSKVCDWSCIERSGNPATNLQVNTCRFCFEKWYNNY